MDGKTEHEKELAQANDGQTAALITQLNHLINFLQTRPQLPVDAFGSTDVRHFARSEAEVDAIAADLHVTAAWNREHTQYTAAYPFGGNVAYEVVFITPAHREAYKAHMAGFPQARPELAVSAA